MRVLALSFLVLVPGCGPAPAPPPREIPGQVWAVSPEFLTRDLATAKLYAGHHVRVTLPAKTYTVASKEIVVAAHAPGVSPLIVFRCLGAAPATNKRSVTLTGICRDPVHDGVWRTHQADFYCVVDECVVTDVLGPSGAGREP